MQRGSARPSALSWVCEQPQEVMGLLQSVHGDSGKRAGRPDHVGPAGHGTGFGFYSV